LRGFLLAKKNFAQYVSTPLGPFRHKPCRRVVLFLGASDLVTYQNRVAKVPAHRNRPPLAVGLSLWYKSAPCRTLPPPSSSPKSRSKHHEILACSDRWEDRKTVTLLFCSIPLHLDSGTLSSHSYIQEMSLSHVVAKQDSIIKIRLHSCRSPTASSLAIPSPRRRDLWVLAF
jgi:hypothetical protein